LRGAAELMNLLPIKVSTWIVKRIGDFMFFIMPGRRKVAMDNLTIAFGESKSKAEKKRLALESFYHVTISMMEFFKITKFGKNAEKNIRLKGAEHFDRAFQRGKGAILIMSHLGPWQTYAKNQKHSH